MIFVLMESRASPDHLAVKAAYLGRPEYYDAVHYRTVPAFCKEHTVTEYVKLSFFKLPENFVSVLRFTVNLCCLESFCIQYISELL